MTETVTLVGAGPGGAELLTRGGGAALVKGGHLGGEPDVITDVLYADGKMTLFEDKRIDTTANHGTGCTLSSAIAANLAKGYALDEAIRRAKEYLSGALAAMLDLGKGSGPMDHAFCLPEAYQKEAQ